MAICSATTFKFFSHVRLHKCDLKEIPKVSSNQQLLLNNEGYSTFLTSIVSPWYLNGLEKSMCSARSGLIVRGATIMSDFP